jgi:hypothetical protein
MSNGSSTNDYRAKSVAQILPLGYNFAKEKSYTDSCTHSSHRIAWKGYTVNNAIYTKGGVDDTYIAHPSLILHPSKLHHGSTQKAFRLSTVCHLILAHDVCQP